MAYNQGASRGYGSSNNNYNPYGQANPYNQQSDEPSPGYVASQSQQYNQAANPYDQRAGESRTGGYGASQAQSYGVAANPYDQRDGGSRTGGYSTSQTQSYSQQANPYQQQSSAPQRPVPQQQGSSQYDNGRAPGSYAMTNMAPANKDPRRLLTDIAQLNRDMDALELKRRNLEAARDRLLTGSAKSSDQKDSPEAQAVSALDRDVAETLADLTTRIKVLYGDGYVSNSLNKSQAELVKKRLTEIQQDSLVKNSEFGRKEKEIARRQYLNIYPDATEEDLRQAEDSQGPIYQSALLSNARRGQATAVRAEIENRHKLIAEAEQMAMLISQQFNDLAGLVMAQESTVVAIEQRGEETKTQIESANVQLDGAIVKAKAARKKKWICLGIVVAIIIVVVVVVVVVVEVQRASNGRNQQ